MTTRPLTTRQDILQQARRVLAQEGANAALHAARKADWLSESGDEEAAAAWRQIFLIVDALQAERE